MRVGQVTVLFAAAILCAAQAQPTEDPALTAIAVQLEAASTREQRAALLDAQPAGVPLFQTCIRRAEASTKKFDVEKALRSYESALAVAQKLNDPLLSVQALRGMGTSLYRLTRMAEALAVFQEGVAIAQAAKDEKSAADLMRLTGVAYNGLGDFRATIEVGTRCLEIFERLQDFQGQQTTLIGMGIAYARLGEFRKAAELMERSARLSETRSDRVGIYKAQVNLGALYAEQGDHGLCIDYLQKAKATMLELNVDKREISSVYINLTTCFRSTGRFKEALDAANTTLDLAREMNDPNTQVYGLVNRANVYQEMRRYREALPDLETALALVEKQKTPVETAATLTSIAEVQFELGQNERSLESAIRAEQLARQIAEPATLCLALEAKGHAQARLGHPDLARAAYVEGMEAVDAMRRELAGGEQQGLNFLHNKMGLYTGMIGLDAAAGDNEAALRTAERAKAGVLLDVLRAGRASITKAMTPQEKERERFLENRLATLQSGRKRDEAKIAQAAADLEAFRSALYAVHPELKVRRGESAPLTLAQAATLLPDRQTALLEFVVASDATYLFAIAQDPAGKARLTVHRLSWKRDDLTRDIDAFREQLAGRDLTYRQAARALYSRLLGPAAAELKGRTMLKIVPDGPLWNLPFQALLQPDGRHVIEDHAVSYASSLTVLFEGARRSPAARNRTLLAMGDPELAKALALPRLHSSAEEVNGLGRLYGAGSVTLTGADASKAKWKELAPRYQVLHLATHGVLNTSNPLYSYVALSPSQGENGFVEAREILDMDLNAELVVLSACETGRGELHGGEGLVGLSWAFRVAGTQASLVSQWKVDSASTTALMLAFHKELQTRGKAAALQAASLRLLRSENYRHPFYWAGFVLIGEGY